MYASDKLGLKDKIRKNLGLSTEYGAEDDDAWEECIVKSGIHFRMDADPNVRQLLREQRLKVLYAALAVSAMITAGIAAVLFG